MQLECLEIPNTGMAVTIDIGDPRDVHPRHKQPVGESLALQALAQTYGKQLLFSSPLFDGGPKQSGTQLQLPFLHSGAGLKTSDEKTTRGFEIAGSDGKFFPAEATLEGAIVTLTIASVSSPAMARYAWAPFPDCNVVNSADLPMSPFRTRRGD